MPLSANVSTALVTGASQGIGLAIARALRTRGVRVIMVARSQDKLERAAEQTGGVPYAADLASALHVGRLKEFIGSEFGGAPDALINAAGAFALAPVAETSMETFDQLLAANLRAPFELIQIGRAPCRETGQTSVAGRTGKNLDE